MSEKDIKEKKETLFVIIKKGKMLSSYQGVREFSKIIIIIDFFKIN